MNELQQSDKPHGECLGVACGLYTQAEHDQWRHRKPHPWPCPACAALKTSALPSGDTPNGRMMGLLQRLSAWDMMDTAADGNYWRREIAMVLGTSFEPRSSSGAQISASDFRLLTESQKYGAYSEVMAANRDVNNEAMSQCIRADNAEDALARSARATTQDAISAEVDRAVAKFPTWPTDPLHALAVLGEEFGELTKEMLQLTYEPHKTSAVKVRAEAVQTAAMALRLYRSLDRYEYRPGVQHKQASEGDQYIGMTLAELDRTIGVAADETASKV